MKIAHVTATFPPYWGGTGNVAYHNARLLHERGHEVTVFTAQTPRDRELSFPFAVERLPAVFRLGNAPLTPSLASRLRGFDLIHLHHAYIFGAELATLASKRFDIPLVMTYHNKLRDKGIIKTILFNLYNWTAEAFMFRSARKIFAVQKDHLVNIYPHLRSDTRLEELPNGVDTQIFHPSQTVRDSLGLPQDAPTVLFVGALDRAHWFKNVEGLLEAFSHLDMPEAHLLIVGEGDLKPSLEKLASELGLSDRVRFVGKRSQNELPPFYSAADVTVLPSLEVESFGLVLIESMACGTPVIASNLPGVRTVVEDGVDGYLLPPGDIHALSLALKQMLSDRGHARCMGERGCEKVRAHYDWNVIGDRLESLYKKVLAA